MQQQQQLQQIVYAHRYAPYTLLNDISNAKRAMFTTTFLYTLASLSARAHIHTYNNTQSARGEKREEKSARMNVHAADA